MKRSLSCLALALGGLAFWTPTFLSQPAEAGWRPLELLSTNMTPDESSSEDSKACVQRIKNVLSTKDVNLNHLGETPLRKLIGKEDKSVSFMTWSGKDVVAAREKGNSQAQDGVLLIDCRPEKQELDVFIGTGDDGATTIRLRRQPLSVERLTWVAEEINRHAWAYFSL